MFDLIKKIQKFIDGYKVYILGLAGILGIVVSWATGAMTMMEAIKAIWAILVGMGFRSAVGKTKTPA